MTDESPLVAWLVNWKSGNKRNDEIRPKPTLWLQDFLPALSPSIAHHFQLLSLFCSTMRSISIITLALASSRLVAGHAYVWGISINGKDQGRGDAVPGYVRKVVSNDPINDVRSPDMTCNKNKGPNTKVINAQSGDKVRQAVSCNSDR